MFVHARVLGLNIISQPNMQGNYVSTFTKMSCQIMSNNKVIATGQKVNNLFYLDIDHVMIPNQALNICDSHVATQSSSRQQDDEKHKP